MNGNQRNEESGDPSEKELEELRLCAETAQVMCKRLELTGDDTLSDKSERLLRLFAHQVLSNRDDVSPSLLYWVAASIGDYVTGAKPNLDTAFGLKQRGRPIDVTPNRKRKICEAYIETLRAEAGRHGNGDETLSARLKAAEYAAYKKLYGLSPEESEHDKGSIDDGLTRVRKILKEWGVYISRNNSRRFITDA